MHREAGAQLHRYSSGDSERSVFSAESEDAGHFGLQGQTCDRLDDENRTEARRNARSV